VLTRFRSDVVGLERLRYHVHCAMGYVECGKKRGEEFREALRTMRSSTISAHLQSASEYSVMRSDARVTIFRRAEVSRPNGEGMSVLTSSNYVPIVTLVNSRSKNMRDAAELSL
jgi:hypothetical protein